MLIYNCKLRLIFQVYWQSGVCYDCVCGLSSVHWQQTLLMYLVRKDPIPVREYVGKHSLMSSTFPIAVHCPILNGTCFFLTVQQHMHDENLVGDGEIHYLLCVN